MILDPYFSDPYFFDPYFETLNAFSAVGYFVRSSDTYLYAVYLLMTKGLTRMASM